MSGTLDTDGLRSLIVRQAAALRQALGTSAPTAARLDALLVHTLAASDAEVVAHGARILHLLDASLRAMPVAGLA